ncbi:putative ABC transporter-associated repeat protein [Lentzea albidocapillata subsp. violacea]|uniref:Putative ABC transporter-associated repeat protein n=1 Tax=Lentzea albidocapillata subsp. violacea TaxID=128104 RepID=A0A1G9F6W6_9PSEU|nr:choice-of-anchor M domain-containing protein [Lentzea albidocapillata]SDK84187.1 putative ABC transporter-associated repeat protein [Lentzea albidocapillata subsp. violacea]
MRRSLPSALLVVAALLAPAAALAQPPGDGPDQTIAPDQRIALEEAVLARGHVDIGPRYVDGAWKLMVHDDTGEQSVWRNLDRTAFQVSDKALLTVPDNPAYAFIGKPGARVHVLPQVQNPEVTWVGWNTQDPEVMEVVDRGVTLTLTGVDGPGELFVYLQAGNFGAADVLWNSTKAGRQDIWVDTNTHTHANWVFTTPGVYLVQVEAHAKLIDGKEARDTATLRFAVGDATDARSALSAASRTSASATPSAVSEKDTAGGSGPPWGVIALIAAVAVLAVLVVVVIVRGRAAKRQGTSG